MDKTCWPQFVKAELDDLKSSIFWRACFTELVGTLLLCYYHIGILLFMPGTEQPSLLHVAIGHGLYVATVVTALGSTSGCHMNPAVTLAFVSLGCMRVVRACFYIISQCVGGIAGTLLLREISHTNMTSSLGLITPGVDISAQQVICTEVIITAFLLIVVVATSDNRRDDIQGSVPLIVGLTIVVNTLLANKASGSCMNPARALGPAVVVGNYQNLWMYWLGPCCGALIGAHLYNFCLTPVTSPLLSCIRRRETTEDEDQPNLKSEKLSLKSGPETDL